MNSVPAQQVAPTTSVDDGVIRMWLHGRQPNTALAYEADARRFLSFCGKTLPAVTLPDLQRWDESMGDVAQATRARRAAAVKSLFRFAADVGYLQVNPAAALKIAKPTSTAEERILSEAEMRRLIGAETDVRLRALLRLLYVCGLRASEACALKWRDLKGTDRKGGQAKILGKGGKVRAVFVPPDLWRELAELTPDAPPESPVVPGRDGDDLDRWAVHRAIKRAARRAGMKGSISPHWLRHAHATHSLDNGCKLKTLQESLGHASITTTAKYLHVKAGERSGSYIKG